MLHRTFLTALLWPVLGLPALADDASGDAAAAGDTDPWREPPSVFATLPKGGEDPDSAGAEAADGI